MGQYLLLQLIHLHGTLDSLPILVYRLEHQIPRL